MPVWPSAGGFPQEPLYQNFQEDTPQLTVRTRMDTGPAKVRRRFTAGPRNFKIALSLTKAQVETLDVFYVTTCEGGALSFDWKHPRTGVAKTCRFIAGVNYRAEANDVWRATFDMEILPP